MKTVIRITLLTIVLSILSFADEYVVISNSKMKDLSTAQIKAIFLKKNLIQNIQYLTNFGLVIKEEKLSTD